MKQTMAIVFSNMHEHMISDLTTNRCMGSIPVGGRYRLIDFVLSGLTNSGIEKVGVITKTNYQSLMDHLGSGREWDLDRKNGGLVILPPFGGSESGMYRGRIEALHGIMGYVQSISAKYVILADCDILANFDFNSLIHDHTESGADITVMYKKQELGDLTGKDTSVFSLDGTGRVREMLINPRLGGVQNTYLNVMIIQKSLLEQLVHGCYSRNLFSFEESVLQAGIVQYHIRGFEHDGYCARFDSIKSYFSVNLALLEPAVRHALFPTDRPIYTKVRDEAPVRYGLQAKVSNSLVADGCLIEGEVENSLLFRGVTVAKGAKVKNCILMQSTEVAENSNLECVIADKNVSINEGRMIMGFQTYPVYISKGSSV